MAKDVREITDETTLIVKETSQFLSDWESWLPTFGIAAGILILSFLFARFVSTRQKTFRKFTKSILLADLLRQTVSLAIRIGGVVVALQLIGAGSLVTAVLGAAGVLGLGVSFAFKDIVENYIAGILLSIRQPFNVGDHVIIEDFEGLVQRMTTRMTMIKSFDGNNISIPNATVFRANITNFSKHPHRRFHFNVGIHPEADPNAARTLGLKAMHEVEAILDDPGPFALIDSIGDSSINLTFFGWLDQGSDDYGQVRSLAISEVKTAIEQNGIEIPDPSYIIRLKNDSEGDKKPSKGTIAHQNEPEQNSLLSTKRKETEVVASHEDNAGEANLLNSTSSE